MWGKLSDKVQKVAKLCKEGRIDIVNYVFFKFYYLLSFKFYAIWREVVFLPDLTFIASTFWCIVNPLQDEDGLQETVFYTGADSHKIYI